LRAWRTPSCCRAGPVWAPPRWVGPGWQLDWGPGNPYESVAAVRAAAASGVGWIDTAPFYGWG
jgi:hypothetical protein